MANVNHEIVIGKNKVQTQFKFEYPLMHKVVRELRIVTETVGSLQVEAVGYFDPNASHIEIFDRYAVDLEAVKWNGTDIQPVLQVMGNLEEIEEAAVRHFADVVKPEDEYIPDSACCTSCGGTGSISGYGRCGRCKGKGEVSL